MVMRRVDTPNGPIEYALTRKRVKRFNLRVDSGGKVHLSVPLGTSDRAADQMVRGHSDWVTRSLEKVHAQAVEPLPVLPPDQCRALLEEALDRVLPLVAPLGVTRPELKVRPLKSQWGNCHWNQGYITLNSALGRCPEELRDYVALHELVHFLHHDHGQGFYRTMTLLMPDWQERRDKLKGYGSLLKEGVR